MKKHSSIRPGSKRRRWDPSRLFSLAGQTAVVTGGSRGLGLEIAETLAEAGAAVVLLSRDPRVGERAAAKIARTSGAVCLAVACDVTSEEEIAGAVSQIEKRQGRIDILVNSAGINIRGPIETLTQADFLQVQQVNVTGTWLACRAVTPGMRRRGYGRIVNIASALSIRGLSGRTPYGASKGAVLNLTRCLAVELAATGVTVNALLPGFFATDMNRELLKKPRVMRTLTSRVPAGRWGELHEIRAAALFLASPGAGYVMGSALSVDGGWTAS